MASPDFRVVDGDHLSRCFRLHRCWICGEPLGSTMAFVLGPMCCVNRVNSEPPSHYDCARFAAVACPFLSQPLARRNERNLPENHVEAAGVMLTHNPTTCCLWVTKSYEVRRVGNGILFGVGEPLRLEFYHRGKPATKAEVAASVALGLPKLREMARSEGPKAEHGLVIRLAQFEALLERQPWPSEEEVA